MRVNNRQQLSITIMDISKQTQQAGDNSTQQQASVINNNYNLIQFDEGKCREICSGYFQQMQQNLVMALDTAKRRELEFENSFVERLQRVENGMDAFSDPAYLKTLVKAQQAAVCTDEKSDYDLLSELLVKRYEVKGEKQQSLYVNKAIELVDEVPFEALLGLTMFLILNSIRVTHGDLKMVRTTLSNLFRTIMAGSPLPQGRGWIQDLALLSAVRIHDMGKFKPCNEWITEQYGSFMHTGIQKESEQYVQACGILKEYGFQDNALVDNELLPGYVHLHIGFFLDKDRLWVPSDNGSLMYELTDKINEMIDRIKALYSTDNVLMETVKRNFMQYLMEDSTLKDAFDWWDGIPLAFDLYPVGIMLGNVNARRLSPSVPIIT